MKPWTMGIAIMSLALAASAEGQQEYDYGRVRYVEPSVVLQRATEPETEEAQINAPFLPGDRLWTDGGGRLEAQYMDGSLLWVAERSKVDYAGQEAIDRGQQDVLRLWAGRLALRVRGERTHAFAVETPIAFISIDSAALVRLDVDPRTTRVTVVEGEAGLDTGSHNLILEPGTTTTVSADGDDVVTRADEPWRNDDFALWVDERDQAVALASASRSHLPDELRPYAGELDENGTWYYEPEIGHVWHPHVDVDWQPYSSGRWVWTVFGWTWVPYEPWGWAPSHYGTWDYSVSIGWYWVPGRTWGPAWVSWSVGPRHVGWCPINRWRRPVHIQRHRDSAHSDRGRRPRGYAQPRDPDPWVHVAKNDFARPHVGRHRAAAPRGTAQRVTEVIDRQPARNLAELTARPTPPSVEATMRARSAASSPLFTRRARVQGRGGDVERSAPARTRETGRVERRAPRQQTAPQSTLQSPEARRSRARVRDAVTEDQDAARPSTPQRRDGFVTEGAAARAPSGRARARESEETNAAPPSRSRPSTNPVRERFRAFDREEAQEAAPSDVNRDRPRAEERRSSPPRSRIRTERAQPSSRSSEERSNTAPSSRDSGRASSRDGEPRSGLVRRSTEGRTSSARPKPSSSTSSSKPARSESKSESQANKRSQAKSDDSNGAAGRRGSARSRR